MYGILFIIQKKKEKSWQNHRKKNIIVIINKEKDTFREINGMYTCKW